MLKVVFCFIVVLGITVYGAAGKSFHREGNDGIIDGEEVDITQYPHQVAVLYEGSLFCGGSILSEKYVLTAAHCVYGDHEYSSIRVGSTFHKKGGVVLKVSKATRHPQYNETTLDYDVGIFELAEKININGNTTKAVQLAKSDSSLKPNDLVEVSGWGVTDNIHDSEVLKAATLPVFDKKHCKELYKAESIMEITDRMLCAGYTKPGPSACNGDSGGALIDKKTSVQFGLVSFGAVDCMKPNVPNVYTYVPAVRAWIQEVTGI